MSDETALRRRLGSTLTKRRSLRPRRGSKLHRVWWALAKPQEPLLHGILRRRAGRRTIWPMAPDVPRDGRYYDRAIRAYIDLWQEAPTGGDHYQMAFMRFGLEQEDAEFVNQVLCSATLGTLRNWANCQDDPWWQAAWRPKREIATGSTFCVGISGGRSDIGAHRAASRALALKCRSGGNLWRQ
jgi:hypothetical protein